MQFFYHCKKQKVCLEQYGLPTPDIEMSMKRVPKAIEEDNYCPGFHKGKGKIQCDMSAIATQAVQNENDKQIFFLNAPIVYGRTFQFEVLHLTV